MYKCGITGHRGILGSEIVKKLKYKYIFFKGDITKKKDVENWVKKNNFDFILHLAAIVPTKEVENNYVYACLVNYHGTKILANAIIKFKKKLKLFFFASTSHVYKARYKFFRLREDDNLEPYSKYGKTKLKAEKYLQNFFNKNRINLCIGRIFSYTHSKQKNFFFIPSLINNFKNNNSKEILFNDVNHYRDFLSLDDICEAIKILCEKQVNGVYNIGSGKKINLIKIIRFFSKKFKKKFSIANNKKKVSFLVSNNKKLIKLGWYPKNNFFDTLKKFHE